jgi:serine/threonine-protein kinase
MRLLTGQAAAPPRGALAEGDPEDMERSGERPTILGASLSQRATESGIHLDAVSAAERYRFRAVLGEGGMGEVRLCADRRVSRSVAMKVMKENRAADPEARTLFLREVHAQARLEHPAIVPVHDVGADANGALFFTMRPVRGLTLEEIVTALRRQDATATREYSRHKLLSAFANACLAVEYAHTEGTLHCDLKPANIMLGPFGEVYVLDWGLARREGLEACSSEVSGTPGYMAPEHIRGEPYAAPADVYGLGAILFELLTLEPLHDEKTPLARCRQTLLGADARPSVRAPDREVPPELEAICVRATSLHAEDRYASVRELYDDLELYMAGDRDLLARRAMSRELAARAESDAERAFGEADGTEARSLAMGAVGRALALDPHNADALHTLVRLMTTPPREIPKEATAEMHAAERLYQTNRARGGAMAFFTWIACVPLFVFLGIRSVAAFAFCTAAMVAAGALLAYRARHPRPDGCASPMLPVVGAIAIGASSALLGPLVMTPTFAVIFALAFSLSMHERHRHIPMVMGGLSIVVPCVLEWLHVLPPSLVLRDGTTCILPNMIRFSDLGIRATLLGNLVLVVVASVYGRSLRAAMQARQERLHLYAWQLRQLLPKEASRASGAPEAR